MYRNRKKMLIVGGSSVAVLAVFGVSAWAIINQSYQVTRDSNIKSQLSGETIYLGNGGSFIYGQMSFNDWLIYNFVNKIEINQVSDTSFSYSFRSDVSQYPVATLLYDFATHTYNISTGSITTSQIVKSVVSSSNNGISIANSFPWDTSLNTSINLTPNTANNDYEYVGSDYTIKYSGVKPATNPTNPTNPANPTTNQPDATDSSQSGDATNTPTTTTQSLDYDPSSTALDGTYTTSVVNPTGTELWKRSTVVSGSTTTSTYSTTALGQSSLIVTFNYTPASTSAAGVQTPASYSVSYRASTNTTAFTSQDALLTFLGVGKTETKDDSGKVVSTNYDFTTSKLASQNYFLFLPDLELII